MKITENEKSKRTDLSNLLIFSIDPESAKDLDDALSIEKLENSNFNNKTCELQKPKVVNKSSIWKHKKSEVLAKV